MINCALSRTTIEKLYKSIYKHMAEAVKAKKPFSATDYIAYVYGNKADVSTPENAAKLVQHIPRLVIDVYNSDFIENQEFTIDLQELNNLTKQFLNPDTGILDIINMYKESSLKFLRKIMRTKENEVGQIDEVDIDDFETRVYTTPERMMPYSALTGTSQELLAADPSEVTIERVDESKKHIYATIKAIKSEIGDRMPTSVVDNLTYQGVNLKVKAVKLNTIDQSELDDYTRNLITRSRTLQKQGKQQVGVVPADDLAIILVTNEEGTPVYFDPEGNVSTKADGGRLVYQFLRSVTKKGDAYNVTNIYGYRSVLTPEEIAKSLRIPKEFIGEVIEEQKREFEELYNIQQKVVKEGQEILLPISGVSDGILYSYVGKRVPLYELAKFSDIDKSVYKSITTIENDRGLFKKGYAVITINGAEFPIDRADAPADIIKEVAAVLTDKNLPFFVRYDFYNQFFNNKLDQRTRRHYTSVNMENAELVFNYSNQTYTQNPTRKLNDNSIDLSDKAIANMSEEQLAKYANTISEVLSKGKSSKDGKFYPAKMTFNAKSLQSETYMRYNTETKEIENEDYIEFVKTLPSEVTLAITDKDVFNSYIHFGVPSELSKSIDAIKAQQAIDTTGPVRKTKNSLVEQIKKDGPIITSVVSRRSGEYMGKPFANFQVAIPGTEETAKAYFPNKSTKVDGKEDPTWPAEGQEVILELRDELHVDGKTYKDVIEVYRLLPGEIKGEYIGSIAERDVSEYTETAIPEEAEELPTEPTPAETKLYEAVDYEEKIDPPTNTETPTDSSNILNRNWRGLFRPNTLGNDVSEQQIKDAENWWKKSPLNKDNGGPIDLVTITNIVNSNAYAKFITSAGEIYNSAILGQIEIYKPTYGSQGTMVDVYHEAWHAFSQLFLTKADKQKLYAEVGKTLKTNDILKIEETLAEDFREYARNKGKVPGSKVKKSIFQRILDFIRKLFMGKKIKIDASLNPFTSRMTNYPAAVQELFDKLYFADKFNTNINDYTASVDNVMFDELNRGIERADKHQDDALSRQDSTLVVESIDSALSSIIDQLNEGFNVNASTLKLLTDTQNKAIAYDEVKEMFKRRIAQLKEELGPINTVSFNTFNSIKDLEDNASAIIRHSKGDHKYIFLASQIEDFTNLSPDTKGGQRIKGQDYFGIKIIADFYEHKNITTADGDGADIIIVNDLRDAAIQYENYRAAEGTKNFQELEYREKPEIKKLTYEQEELLNNIRILQTAVDNWSSVLKYHKDNSRFDIVKDDYNEQEIIELDDEGNPIDETSPESSPEALVKTGEVGKKSLDQLAQKEVLYVMKSLFRIDNNKRVKNKLGFDELADFPKLWRIITREIGTIKDVNQMYDKLVEATKNTPEFKQLVKNKLTDPRKIQEGIKNGVSPAASSAEFSTLASFWQTFSRPRVKYIQVTAWPERKVDEFTVDQTKGDIVGFTLDVADASIDAANVIRKFVARFNSATPAENKYITKIDNINSLSKLTQLVKDFANPYSPTNLDTDKSFQFARAIGIYFDDVAEIKDLLKSKPDEYDLPYLFKMVYDIAQIQSKKTEDRKGEEVRLLNEFMKDPLGVFMTKLPGKLFPSFNTAEVYQRSAVKKLAELQGRYGYDASNYSVLNPEKNLVNEFIDDHSISRIVDGINRAEKLTDLWTKKDFQYLSWFDPTKNSFTNRSQILKSIFKDKGDRERYKDKTLELFIDSGTQIAEFDIGTVTTSLDIYSKFLQEMHMMLKGGVQEFIRHASKKSSFGVKVNGGIASYAGKGQDSKLYMDVEMFSPEKQTFSEGYLVDNIMIPYLASEFHRIIKFKNNKEVFKNYKGYNRNVGTKENPIYAGEVFTAFDNVLTEATKKKLLSDEFINQFMESDLTLEEFLKKNTDLKSTIKTDIINYFNEQSAENLDVYNQSRYLDKDLVDKIGTSKKLSINEQAQILVKAYTVNSWIHNFETINLFYADMTQYDHFKENLHKRNTGSTSGGPKFMTGQVAEDFINQVWNKETYASKYAQRTGKPEYNKFTNYNGTLNTAVIKDVERPSEYLGLIKEALEKDYRSRKGWTEERVQKALKNDLKTYEEMNEADGAGYITIDAYRTLKKLENAWGPQQEELYKKIINNNPISASDVVNFFPVYKLQNFGMLAETLLPLTAMHKFAVMPLIPSEIKGSELEKLHHEMLRNNIQYVTFESGSKVGSVTSNGKPDQVFTDDTMKTVKDSIEFTPNTVYVEYLKVATNVNSKYKGVTTFPTQLRGLILDGLYNQGKISKEKYQELGDEYHQLVADYTETLKLELLNEIGFEEKDGKYYGNFTDFLGMVQRELGKRDMPDHLVRMIGTTPSGKVKTDLSIHLEADTIEKMLLSVLTKRLVKQKVKGEALIQVPSSMYNGLWDNKVKFDKANPAEVRKYLGTNNLPFYEPGKDGTNAMKIAIALQGDFTNLLKLEYNGEEIGTLDRLNLAIKDDKWLNTDNNRKAISLTGARIPIQNLNSMEFAEVWHFLDPSAGNKVVVPTEIVAKAGSDFDVDKIFWMMPYIDSRGQYVTGELTQEELKRDIKDKKQASKIISHQKRALENKLIDYNRKILSLPENYVSLIRPNHTYLVKDFADKYAEFMDSYNRFENMHKEGVKTHPDNDKKKIISPTRTLEVKYNLHKHDVNMVGKDTLGIVALQNKKHPILKSIGAMMPAGYKSQEYNQDSQTYYDTSRDYDMRLFLPHNKVKDENGVERISLSSNYNVEGDRIADLYSHVMNGLLDVEADAWVFYIQANLEEVGVLNYLLEAGVPAETAILFVSQPLIREYALRQKMLKSTYTTLINRRETKFQFVKSQAAKNVLGRIPRNKVNELLNKVNQDNLDKIKLDPDKSTYVIKLKGELYPIKASGKGIMRNINEGTVGINNIEYIRDEQDPDKYIYEITKSLITNAGYYDSVTTAVAADGVLENKEFSKEKLKQALENPTDPASMDFQIATFLHFLEIEKQIKGLESVKRQSNPDTKLLKTIYQIKKRSKQYVDSVENSKVDPKLVEKLRNESILSSFYVNDIAVDLMEPIMPLRLNNKVMAFMSEKLGRDLSKIQAKFGQGLDGEERFTSEFNNAVVNYIFQNFMSNFIDQDGVITELPTTYRSMPVVKKPGIKNGAEIIDGVLYVDTKTLESDFRNKKFSKLYSGTDSYANRGLLGFQPNDNHFPTQASYNKYVVEREYLRTLYPFTGTTKEEAQAHEKFLNQRALLNAFNAHAILESNEYSYTDMVVKTISEFSHLKSKYAVLEQISKLMRGKKKVLQLNDRDFAKGDLAESYYQNIRELADPNVRKIVAKSDSPEDLQKAADDNRRLSEVFQLFSMMAIYQHGVGYNKYGFNKILDDADYIEVMRSAAALFTENNLNYGALKFTYDQLMNDEVERFFKNYVRDPNNLNRIAKGVNSSASSLVRKLDLLTSDYGEVTFDDTLKEIYPELHIVDVPENVDPTLFESESYEDYVPATYQSMSIILDRLLRSGANIDDKSFVFYDFSTETGYTVTDIYEMLDNVENTILPDDITEEVVPTTAAATNIKPENLKLNISATTQKGMEDLTNEDSKIEKISEGKFARATKTAETDKNVSGYFIDNGVLRVRVTGQDRFGRVGGATQISVKVPNGFDENIFSNILKTITHEGGITTDQAINKVVNDIRNAISESIVEDSANRNSGEYGTISSFYESISKADKQKLGTLDSLINEYINMYSDFSTEEEYIEIKKCLL